MHKFKAMKTLSSKNVKNEIAEALLQVRMLSTISSWLCSLDYSASGRHLQPSEV